ncbi:hypothetical protein KAFR_0C04300 [Kazachstania africana CBS 2517]|uniref:Telomere-associated protein Rif1 N-terminal domain-containing protein n=1 Tax=Kazachstania africana (strain ATCC 22294 / BCRC 22015 / CBS 2517 / CECT 1963 / NBRC 1671 / NRRL Y-8276) TaxID=1071382 RepID=H2ASS0_KAZAF|nr:hypothetical protein KAFR_0C04300 [Kazachstania africana CBS 2517]CCF57420.1 hypothetical protein KAFR_0C04300 [Kazachstania africana CBS 2517]
MSDESHKDASPKKNMKALAMIDKHISQRTLQKKNLSPSSTWVKPSMSNQLSAQPQQNAAYWNSANNTSPTPKRRKITSSSEATLPEGSKNFTVLNKAFEVVGQGPSEDILSSPGQKSVAFSDRIDSSPERITAKSSPTPSSTSKPPVKSILRNPGATQDTDEELNHEKSQRDSIVPIDNDSSETNPNNISYWTGGEIHSLKDHNNLAEFKQVIEGGLYVLSSNSDPHNSRRFEIYATFNNLCRGLSASDHVSETNEKKINILFQKLETITDVCLPHLDWEQKKLLGTTTKKDPFSSRIYIQIVRFFTILLSNQILVRRLSKRKTLIAKLSTFYEYSIDTLSNSNSNKVMIISHISFLKEEKFGSYYLPSHTIDNLTSIVPNIKEVDSVNLSTEKLMLLRRFLEKYPDMMFNKASLWLPGEVLLRILLDDGSNGWKCIIAAISVLLDFLRLCLDHDNTQINIYQSIEVDKLNDVVPQKFLPKMQQYLKDKSLLESMTLGQVIRDHINYFLLANKHYKIAADLWLAMVGLLYRKADKIEELSAGTYENNWLSLNSSCFEIPEEHIKLMSLKVWRILFYGVCSEISGKFDEKDLLMLNLLRRPFELSEGQHTMPAVRDGLLYCLNGLTFTIVSTVNVNNDAKRFGFFWDNLLKPLFISFLKTSPNNQLRARVIHLLALMMGGHGFDVVKRKRRPGDQEPYTTKKQKVIRAYADPVRVVAATGISLDDITSLHPNVLNENYLSIMGLCMDNTGAHPLSYLTDKLLYLLLSKLPEHLRNTEVLEAFSDVLSFVVNRSVRISSKANTVRIFSTHSSKLAITFKDILFDKNSKAFTNYIAKFNMLSDREGTCLLTFLKQLLNNSKGIIPELFVVENFLLIGNKEVDSYLSNWVGSTLFPPSLSKDEIIALAHCVSTIHTEKAIENFIDYSKKIEQLDVVTLLHLGAWDESDFCFFVKAYLAKRKNVSVTHLIALLQKLLPSRPETFTELLPTLLEYGHKELVSDCVKKNPILIESLLPKYPDNLSDFFSADEILAFVPDMKNFSSETQVILLKEAWEKSGLSTVVKNFDSVASCLFEQALDGSISNVRKILTDSILSSIIKDERWDLLNNFFVTAYLNGRDTGLLDNFFTKVDSESLEHFQPNFLVAICDRLGYSERRKNVLKKCFFVKEKEYVISLIEALIKSKKFDVLNDLRSEFITFLLVHSKDPSLTFEKQYVDGINNFILLLKEQSEDVVVDFMVYLISPMQKQMSINDKTVLKYMISDEYIKNVSIKRIPKFDDLVDHLIALEKQDSSNLTMTSFSDSSLSTPEGLQISNNKNSEESAEIQVMGTQDVNKISGISNMRAIHSPQVNFSDSRHSTKIIASSPNVVNGQDRNLAMKKENKVPTISGTEDKKIFVNSSSDIISCSDDAHHLNLFEGDKNANRLDDSSEEQMKNFVERQEGEKENVKEKFRQGSASKKSERQRDIAHAGSKTNDRLRPQNDSTSSDITNTKGNFAVKNNKEIMKTYRGHGDLMTSPVRFYEIEKDDGIPISVSSPIKRQKINFLLPNSNVIERNLKATQETEISNNGNATDIVPIEVNGDHMDNDGAVSLAGNATGGGKNNNVVIEAVTPNSESDRGRHVRISSDSITNKVSRNDDFVPVESTRNSSDNDDFVPIEAAIEEDNFIEEMEKEAIRNLERPAKHHIPSIRIPLFNVSRPSGRENTKQQKDNTHTGAISTFSDVGVKINEGNFNTIEDKKMNPSFNESTEVLAGKTNSKGMEARKDEFKDDIEDDEIESSSSEDRMQDDEEYRDEASSASTQSLRDHFPSQNARKLVRYINELGHEELLQFLPEEKRNLRIELLDFLMKLEHYSDK